MARLMALDVGEVRIGVAVSDASGFLASPYTTLRASRDEEKTWEAIRRLLEETEAEGLIVGLPVSLDGQLHTQGERVRDFARRLQEHIHVPLVFWDERYSTVEAGRLQAERFQSPYASDSGKRGGQGKRGRHNKQRKRETRYGIDAIAAAVILQEYLDQLPSNVNRNDN
jgi:putative Holliday junction resolvase